MSKENENVRSTETFWRYHWKDGWKQIEVPDSFEGETLADWATALGSDGCHEWQDGDGDWDHLEGYELDTAVVDAKWLVVLSDWQRIFCYFAADEPSMLELRAKLAPVIHLRLSWAQLSDIRNGIKKWFRANHGHDLDNVCTRCDPVEFDRLGQLRRENETRKRKAEEEASKDDKATHGSS